MATPIWDIYLGDKSSLQGFRCKSFTRDSAPLIAPRFGGSNQTQSDLDLLKSDSVDNLSGGQFQRTHLDSTKVARQVGWFNAFDENTYPTIPTESPSATLQTGSFGSKAESEAYSFVSFYSRSGGLSYNAINKIVGKTVTNLVSGAPTTIYGSSNASRVGSMCLHKGYLFMATNPVVGATVYSGNHDYRYNITAGTWQDLVGGVAVYVTVRGVLYGIDNSCALFTVTNETIAGAATYTQVATVGGTDLPPREAVEYNGAAWITKDDGLYRFDGTTVLKVLSLKATNLTVWNGALYFMVNKWLYNFNGTVVQKLQYFTDTIYQLSSNSDYLFLQTWSTTGTVDSGKTPSFSGFSRVFAFNGAAWSIIMEKDITTEAAWDHALFYTSGYLSYSQAEFGATAWDNNQTFCINLANLFTSSAVTSTSTIDLTCSEFDDGFPNIYKSLEAIEVDYSGLINGDVITVKYQLYDGKTWGSWITAGTLNFTSTSPYIEITDYTNKLFKRMKINVYVSTMTAASTLAIKGFSWRYTLQPRTRWRWQLDLLASGNSAIADRSGASITTDSNYFKNFLDKAIKQKTPQFLLTPDYGKVKTQITGAALSFDIPGQYPAATDPYSEYPLIAVLNSNSVWEILRISTVSYNSGTDTSTITVLERGYLGIANAQINVGAEVHNAHKIYVTRLIRDAPVLDVATYNENLTNGISQLQREYIIEATEV